MITLNLSVSYKMELAFCFDLFLRVFWEVQVGRGDGSVGAVLMAYIHK